MDVPRFIQLSTDTPLERSTVIAWYHCVQQHAPSGVIIGLPSHDQHDRPAIVQLLHRTCGSRHCYMVPVSRDLRDAEVDTIVQAFASLTDVDFEVETNDTRLFAQDDEVPSSDALHHAMRCRALAKQQHEDWVRQCTDAGWRYGTFDATAKTHPLIRPWDQTVSRFKSANLDTPNADLDRLLKR